MIAVSYTLQPAVSEAWMPVSDGLLPEDGRTVIAWDAFAEVPIAVFYDPDEGHWYSQVDGQELVDGAVMHWRHCLPPNPNS